MRRESACTAVRVSLDSAGTTGHRCAVWSLPGLTCLLGGTRFMSGMTGSGALAPYPPGPFPTHPHMKRGASALGSTKGEFLVWRYHGSTLVWWLPM